MLAPAPICGGRDAFDTFQRDSCMAATANAFRSDFIRLGLEGQKSDHMITVVNLLALRVHCQSALDNVAMVTCLACSYKMD